jgi:parallel beta-helix repeat protein
MGTRFCNAHIIYINGASPTIQNDILQNNTGCGIGIFNGAPLIQGTTITNITFGGSSGCLPAEGTGVLLSGYSTDGVQAQLLNNTIENNNAQYSPGGIYLYRAGAPLIENNVIVNNESDDQGGGILMQGDGAPAIVQNLIYGNVIDPDLFLPAEADTGAGINLQPIDGVFNTSIYVTNNTIVDNIVEFVTGTNQQGTQVYVEGYYDRIAFTNNVIVALPQRSAIDCELSIPGLALPQFDHNDVSTVEANQHIAAPVRTQLERVCRRETLQAFHATSTQCRWRVAALQAPGAACSD